MSDEKKSGVELINGEKGKREERRVVTKRVERIMKRNKWRDGWIGV